MITESLTGKIRYRTHTRFLRRPLLVLQVEVRYTGIRERMDVDREVNYTDWRDATSADLTPTPEYDLP